MDYREIIQDLGKNEAYRILIMKDHEIEFLHIKNRSISKLIKLDLGNKIITEKYFKNETPGEAEVEYAINFIEDELMSNDELVNDKDELYIDKNYIIEIINLANSSSKITRQEIEEIFTKYALLSMGRSPIYDDTEMNKDKYAKLLILQEIMHHLKFTSINVK